MDRLSLDAVRKSLKDTIFIIPCDEGGESDFIKISVGFWPSRWFPGVGPVAPAEERSERRGCKRVAISAGDFYKFGEACPPKMRRGGLKPGERIEGRAILQQIVCCGNPCDPYLFLLETDAGNASLWKHLDETSLVGYSEQAKDADRWTVRPGTDLDPEAEYMVRGPSWGSESEVEDMVERDTEKVAEEFFNRGKAAENQN